MPIAERLTAQALAGEPLCSPEAVAERLLAVQGQDPRGARLAIRARTEGVTAADVERALAELARRYLVGHAPADDRDLARWAGLPLRDARFGLQAIASKLVEREDGLVELARSPVAAPIPPPRLLGAFDPLLLGWTSREQVVGPHKVLVTTNGVFRPFALVDGRGVATWRLASGRVTIERLGKVKKKDAAALKADAEAVERFLSA